MRARQHRQHLLGQRRPVHLLLGGRPVLPLDQGVALTELEAQGRVKRAQLEAVVIRADGTRHELGVISDSARHWRFGPGRLLANRRISKLNEEKR